MIVKELLKENDLFSPSFLPISVSEELCANTAVHGLAVCDPRHLLAAPQQLVILSAADCVRGWTFFGKAAGLGKIKDFTRLSTVTLICIAVSQKT